MAHNFNNYDVQYGPQHIAVDQYADWCTERFRELLCSHPCEPEVQTFLERHPWLVPGHATPSSTSGHFPLHCSLITQPKLPGQKTRVPDFMWIATHSGTWFPTLIEIERPSKRIFTNKGVPCAKFTQARNQLNQWRSWFNDPTNVQQFMALYGIPEHFRRRTMRLHMILIYGRRSEFEENPSLSLERDTLLPGADEELMSFDRLQVDTSMLDAITVRAIGHGKYRAKRVLPVFGLRPGQADRLLWIDGIEEAIDENPDIAEERRAFLKRRIPYWKEWSTSLGSNRYNSGDRE